MHFLNLRLQDFRNIEFADLRLGGNRHFFLGQNGQGKSNLLEAIGLATALRSFRTQTHGSLPRKGQRGYALVYELEHDVQGRTALELQNGPGGRQVEIDGEKVTRLVDFIGRFPVVTLCSGDIMLLRGSPAERRRFIDLSLSVVNRNYYLALRDFHRGIAERNRLLKKGGSDGELSAFEAEIAPHAARIAAFRKTGMAHFRSVLCRTYDAIAEDEEGPELIFKPNIEVAETEDATAEAYRRTLHDGRERDCILGSTQRGPHRDDFNLGLTVGGAREYASDGQQRGFCVALRIAQASYYREQLGLVPVLLADDVLGELDPFRREGFWRACPKDVQIIATGTELPADADSWSVAKVSGGAVRLS